jgi:hypothetical protein
MIVSTIREKSYATKRHLKLHFIGRYAFFIVSTIGRKLLMPQSCVKLYFTVKYTRCHFDARRNLLLPHSLQANSKQATYKKIAGTQAAMYLFKTAYCNNSFKLNPKLANEVLNACEV